MLSLTKETRDNIEKLTYEGLFTSETGRLLARDLVVAIVNRNIATGTSVDIIAEALRKRCGSFCSADDVVTFKALENMRRGREMIDPDSKCRLLRESERLFEQVASTLSMDTLKDAITDFLDLQFYAGTYPKYPILLKYTNHSIYSRCYPVGPDRCEGV